MAKNSLPSELDLVQQPSYGLPDWAQRPQAQTVNTGGAVPFQAEFLSASQKYGVPFNVLMGLAEQESSFNPTAIGVPTKYGRAKGLMQYIDDTASRMGINPYDPVQSIDAAARQLRERLDKGYSMQEAVQAHFGGDDRKQWGPKTAQYGKDVLGRAEKFLGNGQTIAAGQPTQQQDQPQTRMEQIAQDYPPAQSAMENLEQTRQRTQALIDEMNKEEPGRYRPLTDEEMQQLSQHITPEMQQQAMQSGKPIEINIPDLVQPGQAVTAQQSQQQPEKRQAELKSWEPTLWERIKGLIPGNKDAATVEMIARDIANREGVSVEEVYKSMGGARPMWNPEGRAPIQALAEGAEIVGKQLPNVPSAVANATLRAVRGGDISADGSTMMDRAVSATDVPQEKYQDPNYQSLNGIDQSLGFSLSNMVPSIAAGAAGNVVSPGVGTAAGFATSGTIAYRASKDQFLDDVKKKAETEKGSKLTEKEWDTLKDTSEAAAMKYGAWEAIPEALSNVIALKMISHPLAGATRAARIADAAKRLGKEQIAEQVTETATTLGQNEAERDVGLSNEKMSVADAFRQQAIQTALVSGIQGGTMQAGRAIYDRVRGNQSAPTETQPVEETAAQPDATAAETAQDTQPEQAAQTEQQQEKQPSGPLGRAVQNGTQQVVNDIAAQAEQNTAAAENHTPDEFMGPVGSETIVHPADDPNDSFPAVVQEYRNGNAVVVDEHGEILEFGPHEVVRPDAAADVAQQQPAQEVTEPVQQAEQATEEQPRQPKAVSEMTEPELRERLKYLHQQAKSSGGWNERLTKARREVEKAIDAKNAPVQGEIDTEAVQANGLTPSENRRLKELLNKDSRTQAESAEATRLNEKSRASLTEEVPQSTNENTVGDEGMTLVHGSGNGNLTLDDIQIVRANGQKQGKKGRVYGGFYGTSEKDSAQAEGYAGMMEGTPTVYDVKIKPGTKVFQKEGDITRLSENTINDLVSKGYGVVVGTDPRGRTEYAVIDKNAIQGISQRGKTQEQVASNEEQNPTLNKDGSQKWFGTERKANEYLQKKGITGTHEIRLVDRRFEIHAKGQDVNQTTETVNQTADNVKPAVESVKGKNGPRYNRVKKLLGAEEGDIVTPQEDIGYTTAGRQYRIDQIGKNGIVYLTNIETGSGTTVNLGELERAKSRKSGFNRVESVAETTAVEPEQTRADVMREMEQDDNADALQRLNDDVQAGKISPADAQTITERAIAAAKSVRDRSVVGDYIDEARERLTGEYKWSKPENASTIEMAETGRRVRIDKAGPLDVSALGNEKKPLRNTRNTGVRFHGTSRPLPEGGPTNDGVYAGSDRNIYGEGFYTTDAVDIASGYTNKGKGGDPTLYEITEKNPVNLYDMDQTMPDNVRAIAQDVLGDYFPTESVDDYNVNTLTGVYDEFRANSRDEGLSTHDVQDYFNSIRTRLEEEGYRGLSHSGGHKTGNEPHSVKIYWYPQDDLQVTKSSLDNYRGEAAAQHPAESVADTETKATEQQQIQPQNIPENIPATAAPEYGANNKLVSQDRAAELRKKLKAKFSQLNSGLDPEILAIGTELAVFHLEAGVRKFADFARTMASDLDVPINRLRPYLRSWYNGGRDMMEDSNISIEGMDSPDTVRAELAKLDDNEATAAQPKAEASEPKSSDDSDKQPRYQLFNQATGGGSNAEFMSWVSDMKSEYTRARGIDNSVPGGATINDQADFTNFIREKVNAERKQQSRPTGAMDDMVSQFDNEVTPNVSGIRTGMEPDSRNAADAVSGNENPVLDGSGRNNRSDEQPGQRAEQERSVGQRDQRVSADGAASRREPGNQPVHQPNGQFVAEGRDAGNSERSGSRGNSQAGSPVEQQRRRAIADNAHAAGAGDLDSRLKAQKAAKAAPTTWADKASIDAALPLLLPEQRGDVLKIEQRHQVATGVLSTNGTGTGKTATGLGAAKRFYNAGKKNIAIVVPTDKVASDWVKFAGMMDMPLRQLSGIDDAGGSGPIVTTYANFGQNDALYSRQWDLIIPDESHYLSSNANGDSTAALDKLRGLTGHPDGFQHWLIGNNKELSDQLNEQRAILNKMNSAQAGYQAQEQKVNRLTEQWQAIEQPARREWQQRWTEQRDLPKVVFLSATPFAYVKNTDYAEGYLFHHTPPAERYTENSTGGYNSANDRERFYMEHFGYRMRYNKLTQPEAGVNTELMEQNFNQWLKDTGALFGRRLDVPFDYDRRFQLIDDAAGKKLDDALRFLNEAENGIYRPIYDEVMRTFDYQRRMFLLESMKARAAVPVIREHLKLGRKVVVFHDYNQGGGFSPFAEALAEMKDLDMRSTASELFQRPMFRINFSGLDSAINTIKKAFPNVLLFNGTVSKGKRRQNADFFNADNSGKNLILVQSDAGREGVSLHDTTGKHQRVEINLGMPVRPVAATQIEGRIYRTGQASDAIFRYMTTGTSWEASTFASKIAERAATAENLALGEEARGLKQSFIDAYNEAEPMQASSEDGKGGKERDQALSQNITPFDKAKTFYWAQQKNTKRRDQREGQDYFATPEPVGLKMVEWANIKPGDKVLEPSAGHGAIARFFPAQSDVTMVEPSYDLSQRAALANGTARIINGRFEDLSRANKFDAIVMNPPFGTGGKTAYEHLAKAAKHLRQGGRLVALVPRGGISERRFDQFFGGDEAKGLDLVARIKMPWVTFERAGTKVATEVLVFERHDKSDGSIIPVRPDLSSAQTINELFDRIEGLTLPERQPLTADEAIANAADGTMYSVPEKGATATIADVEASSPVAKELIDSGRVVTHTAPPAPEYAAAGGWIDPDGKIHLALYNLRPEDVHPTLMHELFHAGMRNIGSDRRWVNLMDRLGQYYRAAQNGGAKNEWTAAVERIQNAQRQGDRMNDAASDHVIEELGAYAVENFEKMPAGIRKWAESIIGAVKNYLQQTFGLQLGKVTPGQLRALAAGAIRNQKAPATSTSFSTPESSQPPKAEEKQNWFNQRWDEVADLPDNMLKTVMPALLRFTPGRFILKRVGKDIPALGRYADVKLQMDTLRDEWHAKTDQESQKWLKYRVSKPQENAELMSLMHDSTLAQVDPSKDFQSILNAIDLTALREKKRGDPAWDEANQKAQDDAKRKEEHGKLRERYNALSPEGKQIYNRVRDLYSRLADAQEQAIIDNMEKAMDIRSRQVRRKFEDEMQRITDEGLKGKDKEDAIAAAKKALNNGLRKDAWNRRARINQLRSEFESNRLAGPYFPLARFGDFFVTARKKGSGEVVSFSRTETAFAQTRLRKQLEKEGYDVETGIVSKSNDLRKQVPADFVARIEDLLKGIEGTQQTQDQVWQLYLQTMPDYSLRKSRIHRKGRAGFEEDALRAFASHMFHGSHQLARMKYSMELGDLIDQAEREAKRTRSPVRSGLVVEQARMNHDYVMNPTSNRISQVATQGAFMWYLAQSPAAALVNMSQTFIVAPAKLAAFYDKGAAAGIPVALGYLNRAMFDLGMGRTFAEKSARVTPEEKRAVSEAYRMGLITRTQSHDVAGIGDSGVKYSPIRAKLMAALSFMFHHTERINREATFLAAYRMAKKRGLDPKNAIRKAADLTWDSHYDYQNSSRPAIMHSNTGKALLVFRNYSLNMLADLAYTAYEMVNPRNKQERREARTQMLGLGATLAFNAGIRGLPLYGLLMAIAGMFSDDGEDPEVELKKTMLQHFPKQMVGIMMDGVPGYLSGVELSGRIGFGDLWFRSDDMDREGDAQFLYWLQQVLGASAGIPYNWYRGVSQINDGYTWRGIETMVPKAIKDPMKAWRYYNEGVSTKNGDPIVDDVGGWNIFKQAMGFTPAKVTEQYKMNSYNMNKQKAITEERSKLLGDFYKAWKAGDEKKVDQITDKMREYSEKYPEMRIDAGTVRSSLSRREKYRGSALGGMNYNQKLVPRLQDEQPGTVYR